MNVLPKNYKSKFAQQVYMKETFSKILFEIYLNKAYFRKFINHTYWCDGRFLTTKKINSDKLLFP